MTGYITKTGSLSAALLTAIEQRVQIAGGRMEVRELLKQLPEFPRRRVCLAINELWEQGKVTCGSVDGVAFVRLDRRPKLPGEPD
ncbi:MAG: hypothetical protein ACK47B_09130 [Armatimonadota bacterium]